MDEGWTLDLWKSLFEYGFDDSFHLTQEFSLIITGFTSLLANQPTLLSTIAINRICREQWEGTFVPKAEKKNCADLFLDWRISQ